MTVIQKKTYPLVSYKEGEDRSEIKISLVYDKGELGHKRGYYADVTPVSYKGGMYTITSCDGIMYLLKEVQRSSKKAETEAIKIFETSESWILERICQKNGFKLVESAA